MNLAEIAIVGLLVAMLVGMSFSVVVFLSFDRLLRIEYLKYRGQWELDGSPIGFMWVPPGAKTFSGGMARSVLVSTWALAKPSWVDGDDEAAKAYAEFKRLSRFSNRITLAYVAGFILLAVIVFLISRR
jgi:hypothetical protein